MRATVEYPVNSVSQLVNEFDISKDWRTLPKNARLNRNISQPSRRNKLSASTFGHALFDVPTAKGLSRFPRTGDSLPMALVCSAPASRKKKQTNADVILRLLHSAQRAFAGTVAGGDATCPFPDCRRVIDGDEMKRQAQTRHKWASNYCTIVSNAGLLTKAKQESSRTNGRRGLSRASAKQMTIAQRLPLRLAEKLPEWEASGHCANEKFPEICNDDRADTIRDAALAGYVFSTAATLPRVSVEVFSELIANSKA